MCTCTIFVSVFIYSMCTRTVTLWVIPFTNTFKDSRAPAHAASCKCIHPSLLGLVRLSADCLHRISLTVLASSFQIAEFNWDISLQHSYHCYNTGLVLLYCMSNWLIKIYSVFLCWMDIVMTFFMVLRRTGRKVSLSASQEGNLELALQSPTLFIFVTDLCNWLYCNIMIPQGNVQ